MDIQYLFAIIDSLGGPQKVNHMLAALNIPTISNTNLKKMKRRAGKSIEKIASEFMKAVVKDDYRSEMEDIASNECSGAEKSVDLLGPWSIHASPIQEKPRLAVYSEKLTIARKSLLKKFPCKTHTILVSSVLSTPSGRKEALIVLPLVPFS